MPDSDELLYCVGMTDNGTDFDLASELFAALELDFSSWEDRESGGYRHTVYFPDAAAAEAGETRIRTAAAQWSRDCGLTLDDFKRFTLKREDWAEAWKKYFHPIEISPRLLVSPSWIDVPPQPGRQVLTLDPGMSFGTGQHATTLYCLQVIDRLAGTPGVHSLLDAGCGSGILAIAGALLGYIPVTAFDFDPDAVRVAAENLEINRVRDRVKLEAGDAETYRPGRQYDLVCANILGHLLRRFRFNIVSWVRPGGYLALAGILNAEFDAVSADFSAAGAVELERRTLREWTSGLFQLPAD